MKDKIEANFRTVWTHQPQLQGGFDGVSNVVLLIVCLTFIAIMSWFNREFLLVFALTIAIFLALAFVAQFSDRVQRKSKDH